ncbi:MAG: hypothetical protein ACOCWR_07620 [Oceanidesulfovibrio sp.]
MSKAWIKAKRLEFARDVLRDFCISSKALEACFTSYEDFGRMGFPALRELTGQEMNKGLLWRLKDTAHLLFRHGEEGLMGRFLDWGLGYIFHETVKLKEDAHQLENYAPWFGEIAASPLGEAERGHMERLTVVLGQTRESIDREIRRIRYIMDACLDLFPVCYAQYAESQLLARYLFDHQDIVREVFRDKYDALIQGIYGDAPENMPLLAAKSLREGGWVEHASRALSELEAICPGHPELPGERALLYKGLKPARQRRDAAG